MRLRPPILLVLLLCLAARTASAADALRAHGAESKGVTVSGVSSGGYMAVQFHIAHSSRVSGAGVLAAGPYGCAQGSVTTAYYNCMTPGSLTPLPDTQALKRSAERLAADGRIDALANLAHARVWLFSGRHDETVALTVVDALRRFYELYVPRAAIMFVRDTPAGHAMITSDSGNACGATAPPFINDCDFDAAGALLEHLLGPLAPAAGVRTGKLVEFDQREFGDGDAYSIGLADTGFVYVPQACASEACRVHVAFHGCRQNLETIGDAFARRAGYNRWADTNRLIVLYPQTRTRNGWGVSNWRWSFIYNPRGCWDWWGYTNADYADRRGPQIRAVEAMLQRLGSPRR